jgi:23S rRNA (uridine2552-2'-O)-methyltransferase
MPGTYQRKDHLYDKAKAEGYRSRAAYKLLELDKKLHFLKSGSRVLDLGCFPGGWLQVAAQKVGDKGLVIGVDLKEVEAVSVKNGRANPPHILCGDVFDKSIREQICALSGGVVDVVLSDMSPKLSGVRFSDAARSAELVDLALEVARELLAEGGTFVAKIFPGPESDESAKNIRKLFRRFSRENLDSSRKTSTEMYFVAQNFIRTS